MIPNATIVRLRGDTIDKYGDHTGTVTRTTLDGCAVAPRSSEALDADGRHGAIIGLNLYGPYGTDLVHTDQLEVDGVVYDIDGEPGQWKSPLSAWEAGFEVALKRAVG